mmetsp:Transcript_9794/g.27348  ORF Transcript_9794/g.27348 Transcript_9794/m.27348 type:complete len:280 (+) Transcript_9794:294-1133(+)
MQIAKLRFLCRRATHYVQQGLSFQGLLPEWSTLVELDCGESVLLSTRRGQLLLKGVQLSRLQTLIRVQSIDVGLQLTLLGLRLTNLLRQRFQPLIALCVFAFNLLEGTVNVSQFSAHHNKDLLLCFLLCCQRHLPHSIIFDYSPQALFSLSQVRHLLNEQYHLCGHRLPARDYLRLLHLEFRDVRLHICRQRSRLCNSIGLRLRRLLTVTKLALHRLHLLPQLMNLSLQHHLFLVLRLSELALCGGLHVQHLYLSVQLCSLLLQGLLIALGFDLPVVTL